MTRPPVPLGYEEKFAEFIKLVEQRADPKDFIVIPTPYVLGDNYAELIESLFRLAESRAVLAVTPPLFQPLHENN